MFRTPLSALIFVTLFVLPCSGEETPLIKTFTEDGAWCWFQDPRAVYVKGVRNRTYAQWVTRDGRLKVGAFDHETGAIEIHTLKEDWGRDDHNAGAFAILPDKRLVVFYARHNQQGIFCRAAAAPEEITEWEEEVTVSDAGRITYAHPVYLTEEKRFYLFWRGPTWKPTFATSRDGKTWSDPLVLILDPDRDGLGVRPYMKVASDGRSTIHFAFTDGHPRNEETNSLYYLRYEKGEFFKADGSPVAATDVLPVSPRRCDRVYDGKAAGARAWVFDIAVDGKGRPVIAYTRLPEETDHRYCTARWTGEKWLDVEVTPGGRWFPETPDGQKEQEPHYSGGMALHPSDPSILYTSRPVDGVFEIERWDSPDQGATWTARALTARSKLLNVRPVVPRGAVGRGDHLLWMFGHYVHYTDFETGIRLVRREE